MSLFDQLPRRAAAAAACLALSTESASAQPGHALPEPTPLSAVGAPVVPVSGFGRGAVGARPVAPTYGFYGPGLSYCPPSAPCAPGTAPGMPGMPVAPGAVPPGMTPPGTTPPGMTPGAPPADPNVAQPPAAAAPNFGDFGRDVAGVGASAAALAPNHFGDIMGARATQVFVKQPVTSFLNGKTVVLGVNGVTGTPTTGGTSVSGNLWNATFSIRDAAGVNTVSLPRVTVMGMSVPNPVRASQLGIRGSFTEVAPGVNQTYAPTGANAATANYVLQYFAGTDTGRPAGARFTIPGVIPVGFARDNLAVQVEQGVNGNDVSVDRFGLSPVQAVFDGNEIRYVSTISAAVSRPDVLLTIPNPGSGGGGGGVVGFIKISEDNSPMPRDRLIFNYDYFDNVPFTPQGIPVNRYQLGFEKTFLDGRGSLEARLPFASTLASDGVINAGGRNTELGNLRLALKALLLRRETVNVSAGLGVYLPTADDITIRGTDGRALIKVDNSSVQLSPFFAALYTPNDRLFAQGWMGFTYDTGGNQVTVDPMMFGGPANIGGLRGANLWQIDAQVGYWVYQSNAGFLRGVAPFVELHYNGTISNGSVLSAGNGVFIGDTIGNSDELNMTAGVTTRLGDQSTLAVAAVAPLRTGQNRSFDYQIGVRLNYFFGYTARNMTRGTAVSTFGR